MPVRAGMAHLIQRLRGMCEAGSNDYTVGTDEYGEQTFWSDIQLQVILDQSRQEISLWPLNPTPEYAGGETIFKDYPVGAKDLESADSNTGNIVAWSLTDGTGTEVDDADYSADYVVGLIRFDADTSGDVYYLRARSYDLNRAAAEVWRRKMGHYVSAYNFSTEGQSFSREAMFQHAREMVTHYEGQTGIGYGTFYRTDLA